MRDFFVVYEGQGYKVEAIISYAHSSLINQLSRCFYEKLHYPSQLHCFLAVQVTRFAPPMP